MLIVGVDLTHSDPQHNTHRFVGTQDLFLNPTLYGGLAIMALPYQLWILTTPTGRFGLVHTSYEFGHIALIPKMTKTKKNVSKFQKLS